MNTKTGFWSAFGALVGGIAGATAGKYASTMRPRYQYGYAEQPPYHRPSPRRGGPVGTEVEDAMVIGGAAGAMLGAFIGGAAAGEEAAPAESPQLPAKS